MNKRKKFASVSLAAVLAIGSVAPGFAAVDSYLLQDKNEEVYEYNFDDLKASYQNSVLGVGESVLYDHFKNILDDDGIYFAIEDDVSGYVDYQDVKTAYGNAMLAGESFDVNDYTETEAPSKELPAVIKEINVQDGETVETEKPISAALVVESVSAINATTINAQMATDVDTTKAADETEYTVMVGDTAVEVTAVTFSTVAKIATITVDMNGEEGTLTVNDTAAEDAADYKKPTATVEGFDATHVVVTFSEAVDKTDAENILNYTMSDPSGVVLAAATPLSTDSTASLAEDGMTLTISLGNSDVTGGLVDGSFYLTINDGNPSATADKIKDLAGNVMDKAIIEFAGSATTDTTGPALTSGTYNNATGALKLFFDEAVSTIDGNVAETKITITGSDDATYVLKETDFSGVAGSASSVTVTFGTTAKAAVNALTTPLTVSVEEGAFKDVATNDSLVGSAVLSLTTAPVLQTATYDESTNELVLTFNEEVLYDSLTDLTNIQVKTDTGAFADISASTTVDTTVDGTVLILTPASPTFRTTGTVTSAELKLKAGAVMDVADEQTNVATTVDLTYTDDAAKPVLETVGYSTLSKIFTLTFSEDVDVSTIAAVNFKAYDADTSEATLNNGTTAVITTVDGPTAQIQLDTADAITVAALEQASMKVSVSTVSDMTGNVMVAISETAETGVSVTTTDLTPPQVTGAASVDANTVTVTFDEKLDPTTANVAGNYAIYATDSPATTMSVTNASVNAAGLVVTLTTSTHENAVGYTVDVTGVTDLAGNLVEDGPDATDTFAGSSLANTAPTVASAAYVDVDEDGTVNTGDKVKVTFSEAVTLAGTVNESDFDLTVTTTPSLGTGAVATISETDATIVEIALGASPSLTVTGTKTKIDVKAINDITDLAGKKAVTGTAVVIQGDETAPTISSATYTDVDVSNTMNGNDTITIVYNEDLDVTVANLVDGSNVIDSYAISNFTSYGASTIQVVDSKTIQITFADDADFGTFAVGDNVVYVDASDSVYDLFANEDAVVAKATVGADEVGPKITAADLVDVDGNGVDAGDKLTLTFDQGIQLGSATAANLADDFTLNAGSDLDMANSAAYFVKDQNQLVLTLGTSATITAGPTINIKTTGPQNIADIYGNDAEESTSAVTINVATDTVDPTLNTVTWTDEDSNGALTGADTLIFTFSEAMDKGTVVTGATMDTILGASNNDFGSGAETGSWNAAGTIFTVVLAADHAVVTGDAFNPAATVTDVAGNADATVFAPTLTVATDGTAPVDVVAANASVSNIDAGGDTVAGEDDVITLIADTNASNTKWAGSGLEDGDFVIFTIDGEILTYTLQAGDVAKLIAANDVVLIIDNDGIVTGGAFTGTIGTVAAFDAAIADADTVVMTLKDVAANTSTGVDLTVVAGD